MWNKQIIIYFIKNYVKEKMAALKIGNQITERTSYTKFSGVVLDEILPWKDHIKKR